MFNKNRNKRNTSAFSTLVSQSVPPSWHCSGSNAYHMLQKPELHSRTGFIWYHISAPIKTASKPESDVHVAEMIIYDLFLFNLPSATIPAITIHCITAR